MTGIHHRLAQVLDVDTLAATERVAAIAEQGDAQWLRGLTARGLIDRGRLIDYEVGSHGLIKNSATKERRYGNERRGLAPLRLATSGGFGHNKRCIMNPL